MNRRDVLAAAALLALRPRFVLAEEAPDGFQVLRAEPASLRLLGADQPATETWSWRKTDAVTMVQARQGELLKVRLINYLDEDIWFHWFGVRGPADQMTVKVEPGEPAAVDCVFTPPDAGTFWFGPLTNASRQRDMGLYGLLVVAEASPPEVQDVALVLDDWLVDDAGKIQGGFGDLATAVGEGRMGNWFSVNGALKPHIAVAAGRPLRLRLLNAANVRSMGLLFKGAEPRIVAYDGQPLAMAQPLGAQALVLAPGQRADLLLPPVSVKTVTIALDLMEDVVELAYLEPQGEPQSTPPGELVLAANPISTGFDAAAARAVTVTLEGGAKGGLKSAWVGDQEMDTRALLERGLAWAMNGVSGTGGPPLFTAKKGEALLVTIDNRTTFAQPLHIHGHVWRVLDRGGEAVADAPWRDTVVVAPRTAVKLSLIADNPGVWVIQSLVAERVDSGMLASFLVE